MNNNMPQCSYLLRHIKLLLFLLLLSIGTEISAQGPPPPPPGGSGTGSGNNNSGNQTGGNAPIGGGIAILLSLGAAYAGRKAYILHQEQNEE